MDFNTLRKEITSKNSSVQDLVKDFFSKIDSKIFSTIIMIAGKKILFSNSYVKNNF